MAKGAQYWQRRRKQQLGRFSGKAIKAYSDPSIGSIARASWSGVKYLRTLINSEVNKRDSGPTTSAVGTTATVLHITAIDQGDTDANRTGFAILSKYLHIKFHVAQDPTATISILRIVVVQDKQQIGDTTPAYTDVFTTASTMAHRSNATTGRFSVLLDKTLSLNDVATETMYFDFKHSFAGKNNHIRYNGTAATDIQKNGIYLMMLSSEATNTPSVITNSRFAFHDN